MSPLVSLAAALLIALPYIDLPRDPQRRRHLLHVRDRCLPHPVRLRPHLRADIDLDLWPADPALDTRIESGVGRMRLRATAVLDRWTHTTELGLAGDCLSSAPKPARTFPPTQPSTAPPL